MLKKIISGWNAAPGAPANWNPERDGPCDALPVRVTTDKVGTVLFCESAWELTPSELALLNSGGSVVLRVAGFQVPVALYVDPPPADEGAGLACSEAPINWQAVAKDLSGVFEYLGDQAAKLLMRKSSDDEATPHIEFAWRPTVGAPVKLTLTLTRAQAQELSDAIDR